MSDFKLDFSFSDIVSTKIVTEGDPQYFFKSLGGNVFALTIDNTTLETAAMCHRKFQHRIIDRRVPLTTSALAYGGAIHKGLEHWYKEPANPFRADEAISTAYNELQRVMPQASDWRTPERCADTITRYIKKYPHEDFLILPYDDRTAVEIPFSLPLTVLKLHGETTSYTYGVLVDPATYTCDPSTPITIDELHIYWTGLIDLAIRKDGRHWLMDHKTTSIEGPTFYDQFELAGQFFGYKWAADQLFGDDFAGAIVNAIVGRPITKTGTSTLFNRQAYHYTTEQIKEWEASATALIMNVVNSFLQGFFPMSTPSCITKYGHCPYFQVCTLTPSARAYMLDSDLYEENRWTPIR